MAASEVVSVGVPTLVTDHPLGRLLASKGIAVHLRSIGGSNLTSPAGFLARDWFIAEGNV
jgi:hypothetical protein